MLQCRVHSSLILSSVNHPSIISLSLGICQERMREYPILRERVWEIFESLHTFTLTIYYDAVFKYSTVYIILLIFCYIWSWFRCFVVHSPDLLDGIVLCQLANKIQGIIPCVLLHLDMTSFTCFPGDWLHLINQIIPLSSLFILPNCELHVTCAVHSSHTTKFRGGGSRFWLNWYRGHSISVWTSGFLPVRTELTAG